MKSIRI
jgi:hypothetical protein